MCEVLPFVCVRISSMIRDCLLTLRSKSIDNLLIFSYWTPKQNAKSRKNRLWLLRWGVMCSRRAEAMKTDRVVQEISSVTCGVSRNISIHKNILATFQSGTRSAWYLVPSSRSLENVRWVQWLHRLNSAVVQLGLTGVRSSEGSACRTEL